MTLHGTRIAVTGATGFLGRYLVDVLLARGAHVVGVVRNPDRVPELRTRGVELRKADLADRAALAAGFAGADAVISNAALLPIGNGWEELRRCNVAGTENVLDAVGDAGVRRLVQVSSVAVYGMFVRGLVDESRPLLDASTTPRPWNAYALSKALAERRAWEVAGARGLALTTVRPCTIYGAFDDGFMPIFRTLMRPPVTLMPVGLGLSFVYAGDVADAVATALERDATAGRAYNVAGPSDTAWQFARAWQAAGWPGSARWLVPVPVPWTMRYDVGRARAELDFRPRSLEDGLRDARRRESVEAPTVGSA